MDDVAPSKFRLSVLGRFELTGRDGPVELPSKKLAGLLAYLACTAPQRQPREKLAALLWGSHFDTQARQNLRQALFGCAECWAKTCCTATRRRCPCPGPSTAMRLGSRL